MKRAYTKPSLAVESFQLDAAIAVGCELIQLGQSMEECNFEDDKGTQMPGAGWFANKVACAIEEPAGDICYQVMNMSDGFLVS